MPLLFIAAEGAAHDLEKLHACLSVRAAVCWRTERRLSGHPLDAVGFAQCSVEFTLRIQLLGWNRQKMFAIQRASDDTRAMQVIRRTLPWRLLIK